MSVVTVRGQLGSGAREIAQLVAERMRADYVDDEITARVALRLGVSPEVVAARERPVAGFWGWLLRAFERSAAYGDNVAGLYVPAWAATPDDTAYLSALRSVVSEVAQEFRAVIFGKGSQFILKEHPGAFHVMVVAPLSERIERVVERLEVGWDDARREIERFDSSLRAFSRRYFHADREAPAHYDLTINTSHMRLDDAAEAIVAATARRV